MSILQKIFGKKAFEFKLPIVDMHAHILHNLDDGPTLLEDSIAMLKKAQQLNFRHIVFTPHLNAIHTFDKNLVVARFKQLTCHPEIKHLPISFSLGREVTFSIQNIEKILKNDDYFYDGSDKYMLLEIPEGLSQSVIKSALFKLLSHGIRPIIAHFERNSAICSISGFAEDLKERGALLQMDAASLAPSSYFAKHAHQFIKKQLVDILASDVHQISHFEDYKKGINYVYKSQGIDYLTKILCATPARIMNLPN